MTFLPADAIAVAMILANQDLNGHAAKVSATGKTLIELLIGATNSRKRAEKLHDALALHPDRDHFLEAVTRFQRSVW